MEFGVTEHGQRCFYLMRCAPKRLSVSAGVLWRKYFSSRDHFVGVALGYGFMPDERRYQTVNGLTDERAFRLASRRASVSASKILQNNWVINGMFDFARQELTYDGSSQVNIFTLTAGLKKTF